MRNGNVGGGPRYDAVEKRILDEFKKKDIQKNDLRLSEKEVYDPLIKDYLANGSKTSGPESKTIADLLAGQKEKFQQYDLNKDGYLNIDEYGAMVREQYTEEYFNITETRYLTDGKVEIHKSADGRAAREVYKHLNGNISNIVEYTYDENGKLTKAVDKRANGDIRDTTEYTYDEKGRMTKEVDKYASENIEHTTEYTYDEKDRKTKEVWKDSNGDIRTTTEYTYDENGRETEIVHKDKDGKIGFVNEYTYDENGRKTKEVHKGEDGKLDYTKHYKYDTSGNVIKQIRQNADYTGAVYENGKWHDITGPLNY
ncbi:MAG: hypothetical protein LBK53_08970 [Heliobacteriaceae bacterium]|nr:hypothetical protein [Heliobacteriaceae bacterium]